MNADLIYDVLRKHEPDHVLLRATRQEAAGGLTDVARIGLVLDRVSPLAVPALIEEGREWVAGGAEDALLAEAEALVEEVTGGDEIFAGLLADVTEGVRVRPGVVDKPRHADRRMQRRARTIRSAPKSLGQA